MEDMQIIARFAWERPLRTFSRNRVSFVHAVRKVNTGEKKRPLCGRFFDVFTVFCP